MTNNETLGLASAEAQRLLEQYGPNEIKRTSEVHPIQIFFSQFKSLLILILIAGAAVSWLVGENVDAIFILAIVILNSVLGFAQEYRAEKAIEALKKMVVERVRVIRDGKEVEIDSKELVPGDIFVIEEGQKIPADGKLIEAVNLETNEASLTGESLPVKKHFNKHPSGVGTPDGWDYVFMGTIVAKGRGKAQVTATGMSTGFGKIAKLVSEAEEEETPLQKNLQSLAKVLALGSVAAIFLTIMFGLFHSQELIEMMLTGISLAVAVVPEGLPAIVTITLAVGTQRMARKKSIIRKLASIEAIGAVDVIASDKTGTLTKNEMRVKEMWAASGSQKSQPKAGPPLAEEGRRQNTENKIMEIGVLCSTTSLSKENGKTKVLGDETEGALLIHAQDSGMDISKLRNGGKLINEFSFDADRKRMSVVWKHPDGKVEVLTKGAPEAVLEVSKVSKEEKEEALKEVEKLAKKGYRLLGFAHRPITQITPTSPITQQEAEKGLKFVGIVAIADPTRPEVKQAVAKARKAGIRVVMVTGDNPLTARTIGEEIGLIKKNEQVITGDELNKLTDEQLKNVVKDTVIFARATPEHKIRIVKAFQSQGLNVAVTGDGVNDAPALKQANVGMAMGITGTDVAKEASHMVVEDDNFASIVSAVEEGRSIYQNIMKSIRYLLGCNVGELLAILGAVAVGLPSPLTPVQILWMNLVTDGLPALALAEDPKEEGIMDSPPRRKNVHIADVLGKRWMLSVGLILGAITLISFNFDVGGLGLEKARTIAFTILVTGQMVVAFAVRKGEKWSSNRLLLLAVAAALTLQAVIVWFPPAQKVFDTVPLF